MKYLSALKVFTSFFLRIFLDTFFCDLHLIDYLWFLQFKKKIFCLNFRETLALKIWSHSLIKKTESLSPISMKRCTV